MANAGKIEVDVSRVLTLEERREHQLALLQHIHDAIKAGRPVHDSLVVGSKEVFPECTQVKSDGTSVREFVPSSLVVTFVID